MNAGIRVEGLGRNSRRDRSRRFSKTFWMAMVISSLLLAALAVASLQTKAAKPLNWSTPTQISLDFWGRDIEVLGGTLYAHSDLNLTISDDSGTSWSENVPLNSSYIAVSDGVIYRITPTESPPWNLTFSKSTDNGTTWSSPVNVMEATGAGDLCLVNSVLVVYQYVYEGTSYGYLVSSVSADFGTTWSSTAVVDPLVYIDDPQPSDIVYAGGKMIMVYANCTDETDLQLIMIESEDNGLTWTNKHAIADGFLPSLKEDSGELYITYWGLDAMSGLCFIKSTDGGVSWTEPILVGPESQFSDCCYYHSLAASSGLIVASYVEYDSAGPTNYVKLAYSSDDGQTWHDGGDATNGDGAEDTPAVAISGGKIHLMWTDWNGTGLGTFYAWADAPTSVIPEFGTIGLAAVMIVVIALVSSRRSTGR